MTRTENSLLQAARREALVVLAWWLTTLMYTIGYCYCNGYDRPVEDLTFVYGFPDWIFWGVVVPWVVCFLFSIWFAFFFMKDAAMGDDGQEAHRA